MNRPAAFSWRDALVYLAIAISLFLSAYKVVQAPITYDEAYTYLRFAQRHTADILSDYHVPNNHILHTLLVRASYRAFGDAPWALRLPAWLGGVALLTAIATLSRRLDEPARTAWPITVAFLPLVIEFNTLARGYSLGAAACCWAMWLGLKLDDVSHEAKAKKRLAGVFYFGLLLSIAVGMVPTYAVFATAITISLFTVRIINRRNMAPRTIAFDAIAFMFGAVPPLALTYGRIRMKPGQWPWGYESATEALTAFWQRTLDLPPPSMPFAAYTLSTATIIAIALCLTKAFRNRDATTSALTLSTALAILILCILRATIVTRWPFPRTLLLLAPLVTFTIVQAMSQFASQCNSKMCGRPVTPSRTQSIPGQAENANWKQRTANLITYIAVSSLIAWSLYNWNATWFPVWRDNAGVPAAVTAVADDTRDSSSDIAIAHPWQLNVCIEYELKRRNLDHWKIVDANDKKADYRILRAGENARRSQEVFYKDKKFGIRVARMNVNRKEFE